MGPFWEVPDPDNRAKTWYCRSKATFPNFTKNASNIKKGTKNDLPRDPQNFTKPQKNHKKNSPENNPKKNTEKTTKTCLSNGTGSALKREGLQRHGLKAAHVLDAASKSNSGLLVDWLAGLLVGLLACWLAGWVTRWLGCWLACWLAWALLGSPRLHALSRDLLDSPGLSLSLLGSPGLSWALLGFLGPLSSPGLSWAVLSSLGLSWAILGSLRLT